MFRRQRIFIVFASALWLISGSFVAAHASPATDAGVQWLSSTQNADGYWGKAFGGTPIRDTTAAVNALRELSPASTNLTRAVQWLLTANPLVVDYTARRITALAGTGNDLTASLTALKAAQHPDGGWGLDSDHESNPLDTALALQALAAGNETQGVTQALGYLLAQQQANGAWLNSEADPSVQITALTFRALWLHRNTSTSVPPTLTKARDFLLSQRDSTGSWGEPFNTALSLIALVPYLPDTSLVTPSIASLQSAQLGNGSWGNDPYTTALALQALRAIALRGSGTLGSGAVSGYVVKAGSTEPIAGATVSLNELPGVAVLSNADGYFLIPSLAAGSYTVTAVKAGYNGASLAVRTQASQITLAGNLMLAPSSQTGLVRGRVYQATDAAAVSGAVVSLAGTTSYSAVSNSTGAFDLGAVAVGSYTLTIQKSGYATVGGNATVAAGQTLVINQGLTQDGAFQDTSPGTVTGTVVNAKTGAPIAGAILSLGGSLSGTSGANGTFSIASVPRGSYSATLSAAGYVTQTYFIAFPAGAAGNLGVFALYPSSSGTAPTSLRLTVTVVDGITRAPISGASVTLVETGAATTTGADGRAVLDGITLTSFNLALSAAGYPPASYGIQVAAFGEAQATLALSPPGTGATTSTLQGVVTDTQTNAAIAGARVTIDGTNIAATTAANGSYNLSGIAVLDFTVSVSATGYAQKTSRVQLAAHGDYTFSTALQPATGASFQIVSVRANQGSSPANSTALFTAEIANLLAAARSALVIGEVVDAGGNSVAIVVPYAEGTTVTTTQFSFAANETKVLTVPWSTGQFAPGTYTLVLRVIEPGSVTREAPLGQVLAEGSGYAGISASAAISGAMAINPPLTQAGANTSVSLSALVRNAGNTPLAAGVYVLTVTDPVTSAVLYGTEASADAFDVGKIVNVAFGQWTPTRAGNLTVTVASRTAGVSGQIDGKLYIGDKASGTFIVDRTVVPEGTQTVRGRINVQGVDPQQGSIADPLLALLRDAIRRGGQYVAPNAINSLNSKGCTACHVASQSYYGLASAAGKVDIDKSAEAFLYNVIVANQNSDGALSGGYAPFARSQTLLGIWALGAASTRNDAFRTRFRAAKYLYGQRTVNGNLTHWVGEINPGLSSWWDTNDASTAMAIGGLADVLQTAPRIDPATVKEYSWGPGRSFGTRAWDMAVGPDGAMYLAKIDSGTVDRMDLTTGAITTVMSGLGPVYGLAFANDGTLYATGPGFISKRNPDGTTARISSSVWGYSIAIGPDGYVYVGSLSDIYRVSPTTGASELLVRGGRLINAQSLAFDGAGNLLVANYGGTNILKVAPDKTVTEFAGGMFYPMRVKVAADGYVYVTQAYFDRLIRLSPNGVAESLLSMVPGVSLVAPSGDKVFVAKTVANTLHEVQVAPMDLSLVNSFPAEVAAAARYLLSRYQDNSTDSMVQAQRMIGLARARPAITDSALLASIDAAMAYEDALLRGRQNADGGWGHRTGQPSDALVTAMVGIALDYASPAPDDPLVLKAVQYLLNTQAPDGSWGNVNNGLSTRLGATSFVMAYLPAAFERLGGIDTDLHLELASNVTFSNPTVPPSAVTTTANGGQEYVWQLRGILGSGRTIEFDQTLLDMQLNESRPVARVAYLEFANSFTNEKLRLDLGIPRVQATSGVVLAASTNKQSYLANELVTVTSVVSNAGAVPISGQVLLSIRARGATNSLADLAPLPVGSLAPGASVSLTGSWNTATTLTGSFEVYGRLVDAQGRVVAEAVATFDIRQPGSAGPVVSLRLFTDRPVYYTTDRVNIHGLVGNATLNTIVGSSQLRFSVVNPAGQTVFSQNGNLGQLLPGAILDVLLPYSFQGASVAVYRVQGQVVDLLTRAVLAQATTQYEVRFDLNKSLVGRVQVAATKLDIGATQTCTDQLTNTGTIAAAGLEVRYAVVNLDSQQLMTEQIKTMDLAAGGQSTFVQGFTTAGMPAGNYACTLRAKIDNTLKTLAFAPFTLVQPPVRINAELRPGGKGRLLIWLDSGRGEDRQPASDADPYGPAEAPGLAAQRRFLESLLKKAGWSYTITDAPESFTRELYSGGYTVYALFAEKEKLSEEAQKVLREAVFRGEGLLVAGPHDARHYELHAALGIKLIGRVASAIGVDIPQGTLGVSGSMTLIPGDKALRLKRLTAQSAGVYRLGAATSSGSREDNEGPDCRDDSESYRRAATDKSSQSEGEANRDECEGSPQNYLDAVTLNSYGLGRSVFTGFDLLAQATRDGAVSLAAQTLLKALDYVQPNPMRLYPGTVVPVDLNLENRGSAVTVQASVTLPVGVRVIDAGNAQVLGSNLRWALPLAIGETRALTFWIRLPDTSGAVSLQGRVEAAVAGGAPVLAAEPVALLTVEPAVIPAKLITRIDNLLTRLSGQGPALRQARDALKKAENYWPDRPEKALTEALRAAEALPGGIDPEIVALHADIAVWIRLVAQALK
jgi:hypothetical protein